MYIILTTFDVAVRLPSNFLEWSKELKPFNKFLKLLRNNAGSFINMRILLRLDE
jgi:hypothetical protein|tara:strand:+ start:3435 stop:3596 length:162 start_codon:yes stop_codon:yes gene_type:complete